MQIAGETCNKCGDPIVLAADGACCETCGVAIHQHCEENMVCAICRSTYKTQTPPDNDPARDTTVPRALRGTSTNDPWAVAGMIVLLGVAFLCVMIYFAMRA